MDPPRCHSGFGRGGKHAKASPHFAPKAHSVEECWSKIKTILRTAKARTLDELIQALKLAFAAITERDALV